MVADSRPLAPERASAIGATITGILTLADVEGVPPAEAADHIARERIESWVHGARVGAVS